MSATNEQNRARYILRLYHYCSETGRNPDQIAEEKAKPLQNPVLRELAEECLRHFYNKASQKAPGAHATGSHCCKAGLSSLFFKQKENPQCELAKQIELIFLFNITVLKQKTTFKMD